MDPYDILGVAHDAGQEEIRTAYRRHAKTSHPDSGGDPQAFLRAQAAYDLLCDPERRKVFDDTGYDLQATDAADLQAVLVIEALVNAVVLDVRVPGSFDPVARMRAQLSDDIRKARFQIDDMQGHSARIVSHLDRLAKRQGKDILGHMLRARVRAIAAAIAEAHARIAVTERALAMIDGYDYAMTQPDASGGSGPAGI